MHDCLLPSCPVCVAAASASTYQELEEETGEEEQEGTEQEESDFEDEMDDD